MAALAAALAATEAITVRVVSETDGSPVAGAFVLAFTQSGGRYRSPGGDRQRRQRPAALPGPSTPVERLYVYPVSAYRTMRKVSITLTDRAEISLHPLD